ncbi:MAG TPA: hypothetical protein VFR19_22875 [Hyphomicrobiaceae bacterium]|jgi:hypothetical protein|nr:hypothetical protein [Hyphomicrobiaceae bacterium]
MINSSSFRVLLAVATMAGWPAATAFAQNRPPSPNAPTASEIPIPDLPDHPYPSSFHPSFQWSYSCPRKNAAGCLMSCSPNPALSSVAAAQVWLGTNDVGSAPVPTVFYYLVYYNGADYVAGTGFVQSTRNLACQALGMKITYAGPPK